MNGENKSQMAFQSTPPVKAATALYASRLPYPLFQSTPPVKAATESCAEKCTEFAISIHAAREGGDFNQQRERKYYQFQSTPPVKAATSTGTTQLLKTAISIHAAREGGDAYEGFGLYIYAISIHAAREGGDILQIAQ